MITEIAAITVKQLNFYVKSLLEGDSHLQSVTVTGELSNFKNHYASGHWYFTLKDGDAAVRCVMFRAMANSVRFDPHDGDTVVLRGRVSIYEKDGQYQFYAEQMLPVGAGALAMQFERIKERLKSEGLFDASRKRPLPKYPENIAVITSDTGAAVRDILSILDRRYPAARIIMCPVTVQGENAVPQMLSALDRLYRLGTADAIIIGRGGGSAEDLWEFNDETLARKIALSPVPVISAVGHETDFTICDFVADMRAPTPSAAAELAVPDQDALRQNLDAMSSAMASALSRQLKAARQHLNVLSQSPALRSPTGYIEQREKSLELLKNRLVAAQNQSITRKNQRYIAAVSKLDAMSPLKVLTRGYSMAQTEAGEVLCSVRQVELGERISVLLSDGKLSATVMDKKEEAR